MADARVVHCGVTFVLVASDEDMVKQVYAFTRSGRIPENRSINSVIGILDENSVDEEVFRQLYGASD